MREYELFLVIKILQKTRIEILIYTSILKTADTTKRIASTSVMKKSVFSAPRRVKDVDTDAVPPSAPSTPSPERCRRIEIIKRREIHSCNHGRN